jgi:hypothetical protein
LPLIPAAFQVSPIRLHRSKRSPTVLPPKPEETMADPIAFYFDFSSPYGYLASTRIDALAEKHGRMVTWRPFLLGVAFKTTGQLPLVEQPLRGPYSLHDFARSARLLGVRFQLPRRWREPSTTPPSASAATCAPPRRWRRWRSRSASNARPCSRPSTTRP